jgi:hypothetical protein
MIPPRLKYESLHSKESSVQALAETCWQVDGVFLAQQLHNIPNAVIDGSAVSAFPQVVLNPDSQLRRQIVLEVIRQLPANRIAIDFHNQWFRRHNQHQSIGCPGAEKVTFIRTFGKSRPRIVALICRRSGLRVVHSGDSEIDAILSALFKVKSSMRRVL